MRSLWVVILPLVLFLAGAAQAQDWQKVNPPESGFRAEMPAPLMPEQQPIRLSDGQVVMKHQIASALSDMAFVAMYADYPAELIASGPASYHLNNAMNGTLQGNRLENRQDIVVNGYPGFEYMIIRTDGLAFVIRSALAGNRLYQFIVAGRVGVDQRPETRRFLQSIELTQR